MHKFTSTNPTAGRAQVMLTQRQEVYAYVAAIVGQHRAKTFKDPATAAAVVAGLGKDAAASVEWDAAAVAFLNAVGPSLGKPAVPVGLPTGYVFTPFADGSGVMTTADHETDQP